MISILLVILVCMPGVCAYAQTGSIHEPVRYVGGVSVDPTVHDGRLRPVVGVSNYQVFRANRTHPEEAEGCGWTYSHAPMLAYWNNRYWIEYLSNPVDEHISPGQTLLTHSEDGIHWSKPDVVFPPYEPPAGVALPPGSTGYMMHQRMGFYVAPNGRLLALAFYGHAEDPFLENGIGRVVREVHQDGSFGPIYFIRYSSHAQWNESNTAYPLYTKSPDAGFREGCKSLLDNKLMTLQWWEEDHGLDGFYNVKKAGEALSFYHRKDGKVVGLWKFSLGALSDDEGRTFSPPVKMPSLVMSGAKVWGQRTCDGRYALVYDPAESSEYRYPLAIVTGDDGVLFDDLCVVHGEVPPRRFFGRWKDFGPQYMRGIEEGNGTPPDKAFWITYSMNKEDIWISRIPVPVTHVVEGRVHDTFDTVPPDGVVPHWNIYSPRWAPVAVASFPSESDRSLSLLDSDPYDYAKAVRVFAEGNEVHLVCKLLPRQNDHGMLEMDVVDQFGNRPVSVRFDEDGLVKTVHHDATTPLCSYEADTWYTVDVTLHAALRDGWYSLSLNGTTLVEKAPLTCAVKSVERLSFRTGPYRLLPTHFTDNETPCPPLSGADDKLPDAQFYINEVQIDSVKNTKE